MNHTHRRTRTNHESLQQRRGLPKVQQIFADAVQLHQAGQLQDAIGRYQQAIGLRRNYPEAHYNLGLALQQLGRLDEAVTFYRRAIDLKPDYLDAHSNLGVAFTEQGRLADAASCFQATISLRPDYPQAINHLGVVLQQQGRLDESVACFRKAIALEPGFVDAFSNLGIAFQKQDRLDEAAACYQKAIDLAPNHMKAHNNLGVVLKDRGRFGEAAISLRKAIAIRPDFADAYSNLGVTLKEQGRLDEAMASYTKALEIDPSCLPAYSNLLFAKNYLADHSPSAMRAVAEGFGALVTSRTRQPFTSWSAWPSRQPLRVGLVSGDLRNHPVGYFLEGVLSALDPKKIELVAFPSSHRADELTERIKPRFTTWQPIDALNDEAAARLIHTLGVQVLLDLSGHTDHNRLALFGWRPAPVQATWLGYSATTGVAEMDYIIGDPNVTPPGEADHFTEAVWLLPEIFYCFTPPAITVEVSGLPALSKGWPTFGCFNNLTKVSDAVIAVWARILKALPESRLMLKAGQLVDGGVRSDIVARFAALGVGANRLLLEPASVRAEYLGAYHRVDISLDPFPYPGGTTSAESLWMGVPMLTRQGDRFFAHAGETILRNAGLPDWIAADDDDYVVKAVRFASNLDQLTALRGTLRGQVLASPLFDAPRFARHFEEAMRDMWMRKTGHQRK